MAGKSESDCVRILGYIRPEEHIVHSEEAYLKLRRRGGTELYYKKPGEICRQREALEIKKFAKIGF